MTGRFAVLITDEAQDDFARLADHLLDQAETVEEMLEGVDTMNSLRGALQRQLSSHPMIFRKAADQPFLRELIVPLGATGYVVLFEVLAGQRVSVLAVRHQREDDYH
jgi:plasmid stabilization system protein ParE